LKNRALKSNAAGDTKVFVICNEGGEVIGYYAICAGAVSHKEATRRLKRNAPDPIPIALIARLAVREDMQKQGIGPALLRDATLRISQAAEKIGVKGILVHALDDEAASFYTYFGFRPSSIDKHHLMISMTEIIAELSSPPDN